MTTETFSLFLCGDVMTGRGIDQVLPHPSSPEIYESFVQDAREYVLLAEQKNGKFHYPVNMDYIWSDALNIWQQQKPAVKIINLETAITQSNDYWPRKGINYRMHPHNIDVLKSAGIDICTLANNHVLDWGYAGLTETLLTLNQAHIQFAGAGGNIAEAVQPAILKLPSHQRILVFSAGTPSSGVPSNWQATTNQPGVFYLSSLNENALINVANIIKKFKQENDLIVFSVHWGSNWGYDIPNEFRFFAHGLIDEAQVDVIFGHSSHHFRPIEIYRGKPIFYGCGDFINDYEGITGYEEFRDDLTLMYFIEFDSHSLQFKGMSLFPLQIKNFRLQQASSKDCEWILNILDQINFDVKLRLDNRKLIF